jgi:hypothetical protein
MRHERSGRCAYYRTVLAETVFLPRHRGTGMATKRINYRKLAFTHEQLGQLVYAHCGSDIRDVLEVAHLDCGRGNNDVANLAIFCPELP